MGLPGRTVYEKYKKIGELKRRLPLAEICQPLPQEATGTQKNCLILDTASVLGDKEQSRFTS